MGEDTDEGKREGAAGGGRRLDEGDRNGVAQEVRLQRLLKAAWRVDIEVSVDALLYLTSPHHRTTWFCYQIKPCATLIRVVASVSDGLKAWETLKEHQREIDLILIEVELPELSGFQLLTMIMEDETCKKIPVIMMSSHDYIGMVFKFMLKGAADFLVKPLRKNELRNLWQHVWRRRLSGESGKPNARQQLEFAQHKFEDDKMKDHIGKGSDSQSSCTQPTIDTEGACIKNMQEGNDMHIRGVTTNSGHAVVHVQGSEQKEFSTIHGCKALAGSRNTCTTEEGKSNQTKACIITPNLLVTMDNPICDIDFETRHAAGAEVANNSEVLTDFHDTISKQSSIPELELSLKVQEAYGSFAIKKQNILNHSNHSAFSRYGSKSSLSAPPAPTNSQDEKEGCCRNQQPMKQHSHEEGAHDQNYASQSRDKSLYLNGEDTSSTLTTSSNQEERAIQLQSPHITPYIIPTTCGNLYTAVFPTVEQATSPQLGAPPWLFNTAYMKNMPLLFSTHPGAQIVNNEQHCSSYNQSSGKEICNAQDQMETGGTANDPSSMLDHSESSNVYGDQRECANDMHGIINDGSNQNSAVKDVTTSTMASLTHCGFPTLDETDPNRTQRSIHREAALNKFRLKRKERCFEKKVRYHSRKKLAEERPRIKGQFVRRVQPVTGSGQLDSCGNDLKVM